MEFSSNLFLFFMSLMLVTFRTFGNPPVPDKIESLQGQLKEVILESENLIKGKDALIKEINLSEITCNETLAELKEVRNSTVNNLLKYNETLGLLTKKQLEEDVVHEKLESKLKELYSDLKVSGVIYETKYQELVLLESTRLNGTDLHCATIMKKLEKPRIIANTSELQTRSLSSWLTKFRRNEMKEVALQNRISIAKIQLSQHKAEFEALNMTKQNNKEMCEVKISELNKQIADVEQLSESFKDTIEVYNLNIQTSIFLTESFNVELQFGEELLGTMKSNINKFKRVKESFKRDEQCYAAIKGMDSLKNQNKASSK